MEKESLIPSNSTVERDWIIIRMKTPNSKLGVAAAGVIAVSIRVVKSLSESAHRSYEFHLRLYLPMMH